MVSTTPTARASLAGMAIGALVSLHGGPVLAQSSNYSSDYRNSGTAQAQTGTSQAQGLVDELNKLIDEAAAARAADPNFLRDLRDLARRFDWPWRNRVLFDDFADGNVTAGPAWTVGGAPVTVDRLDGMRTRISTAAPQATTQRQPSNDSGDVAVQILGQLLRQGSSSEPQKAPEPERPKETIMATSAGTANQFALQADIVFADAVNGYIELGVIQGNDGLGYRIGIRPGTRDAAVELLRIGSRGSSVINSALVASATWAPQQTRQPKTVLLTRDDAGDMNVSINGAVVLSANDRGFRDRFDGFILRNGGGDYVVKSIAGYSK
ncbi:MAG: hypothetical protein GKS02_09085 [Alphaproteobacteria bacterium]|nr:hypothetical protein [Alphaproteobacteria bacterium]